MGAKLGCRLMCFVIGALVMSLTVDVAQAEEKKARYANKKVDDDHAFREQHDHAGAKFEDFDHPEGPDEHEWEDLSIHHPVKEPEEEKMEAVDDTIDDVKEELKKIQEEKEAEDVKAWKAKSKTIQEQDWTWHDTKMHKKVLREKLDEHKQKLQSVVQKKRDELEATRAKIHNLAWMRAHAKMMQEERNGGSEGGADL